MEKKPTEENVLWALRKLEFAFGKGEDISSSCPICGNTIHIKHYGNSFTVKCETENCIDVTSRGL